MKESLWRLFFHVVLFFFAGYPSNATYSGSWCPYQVEKLIPCRIKNGTEPYYGPKICWKSINGSFSCTKKILHKPKYVTTYKKIFETQYKCCPGFEGVECQNECFNCTAYQDLFYRVVQLESKFHHLKHKDKTDEENNSLTPRGFVDEEVLHGNIIHDDVHPEKSLTFIALNTRITSLINEFRDMELRIRHLETHVHRLHTALDDRYNYAPQHHSPEPFIIDPAPLTQGPQAQVYTTTSTTVTTAKSVMTHKTPLKPQTRHLEDNLERGDIASTLNDDYGEDVLENSTEQYVDLLHKDV